MAVFVAYWGVVHTVHRGDDGIGVGKKQRPNRAFLFLLCVRDDKAERARKATIKLGSVDILVDGF